MADLKKVYTAVDEEAALDSLEAFAAVWDSKYPKISKSWLDNWPNLSTYFKFSQELRKFIYTTNTIEGFNRQLKKVTKAKSVFPTDDSLFQNAVSGHEGHHEKVDRSPSGLESYLRSVGHLLRRQNT